MKVTITIEEKLSRTVQVEAESHQDGLARVKRMYDAEEIVLGPADHVNTAFIIEAQVTSRCEWCGCIMDDYELYSTPRGRLCRWCIARNNEYYAPAIVPHCEWCNEPFECSELTSTGIGNICDRCIAAIRSRGESLEIEI